MLLTGESEMLRKDLERTFHPSQFYSIQFDSFQMCLYHLCGSKAVVALGLKHEKLIM